MEQKIKELEDRIKALEQRPIYIPFYQPCQPQQPITPYNPPYNPLGPLYVVS